MLNRDQKELIVAYFQGGNAKEMFGEGLKETLNVIKEIGEGSSPQSWQSTPDLPPRRNEAR